jgi:hypothetical protein
MIQSIKSFGDGIMFEKQIAQFPQSVRAKVVVRSEKGGIENSMLKVKHNHHRQETQAWHFWC